MGKKVYLLVLSGTEVEEGGPVIIVNSQQTLFSQFCNKGLHLRNLANNIGFPAPLKHKESHLRRDYLDEPMLSIVTDVRYEATMTATQNHYHRSSVPVARTLMQRSRTYDTFTEAYLTSKKQDEIRCAQSWNLKSSMEFTMNSRNPRLSQNLFK